MYRVTTICDIVLNGDVLEKDFDDCEYFETEKAALKYKNNLMIGDIIGYHGEAADILKEIYIDEI